VTRGPALSGYYTTYPGLDRNGTAVLVRNGRLLTVGARRRPRTLFRAGHAYRRSATGRILLDQRIVTSTLDSELLIRPHQPRRA
jgi:hypothetical protein